MFIAIVQVIANRISIYQPFPDEAAALAHCELFGGLIYQGRYSPDLFVDGENISLVARVSLPKLKTELSANIDNEVAGIYQRYTRFQGEYELREAQALAFQAAGYAGEVPRQVAAFADRARMPYQQATDLILSQAIMLRTALGNLGDLRMRKYEVSLAADAETAQAKYDEISAAIAAEGASIT